MSSLLVIILQLISALPEIIAMVERIIEMIRSIRDRKSRLAMKAKLRKLVLRRKDVKKMSASENADLLKEMEALQDEVFNILDKESGL